MRKNLLVTSVEPKPAIAPGVTAQGNGLVVNKDDFNSMKVFLAAATVTSGSLVATVQTGNEADGSDMADFKSDGVNVDTTETITTTNGTTVLDVRLEGALQYVRVVTTITGTVSAHTGTFVFGDGQYTDNFFSGE